MAVIRIQERSEESGSFHATLSFQYGAEFADYDQRSIY